ncbi:carboxymuconolactone decarboxylase family protein [Mariniblastus fucicola]|uniref:Peroxidase n=1 Tax=Mariniblastus fucicola TaxID=980251 RepID=A0A5B9PHU2_9BACT|nr:hypothetical protein [Mariniblastus fucicola]QEG24242.1 hypothetical protein MFFC18_41590 [Mariniblastus fucicola]
MIWDYRACDDSELDAVDRALCDYAVKLTLTPGQMDATDVGKLKALGLIDSQITVVVQVIGYFNYINRVADGLDVEPEGWMSRIEKRKWLAEKAKFSAGGEIEAG